MSTLQEEKLENKNIKPTAMRLLVLQCLMEQNRALSLNEIEVLFENADKSTIFRTLKTFQENYLVHRINDGSGAIKYALCDDDCICSLKDNHIHFLCTKCEKTYCLKDTPIATPTLPNGFKANFANYLIEGICSTCT
ncbi:Fur family transcriptional regulator [Algoriphagus pacificus]|uniref:Transcriptional repressor n=1 Tax=Algoriphagus pacificus TaxID=2811234 RepID=A0ABS3CID6_9BACT|nr:transcriptional repressor [Algoriphagus pacificus]MBN7816859.1 transcriptional repressor [Algoriphagus pacificus]